MDQLKRVLITGANRGLGFALAKALLQTGKYFILLTARNEKEGNNACELLKQINPNKVGFYQLDVSNDESIKKIIKLFQQQKIDVIVHNAGITDSRQLPPYEAAQQLMQINLFGVINFQEAIQPLLTDDAKILLISSDSGQLLLQGKSIQEKFSSAVKKQQILQEAQNFITQRKNNKLIGWTNHGTITAYHASKVLLNAYCRYILSKSIKENQNAYCLHPGWCRTEMGTMIAPKSIEEGIQVQLYLIDKVPYGRDDKLNGQFINEDCSIWKY